MNEQVTHICKTAWFQLRKIGQIRKFLDVKSAERVIHAFVTSRLDQNNCLLFGLPDCQIKRLKRVQYGAAQILLMKTFHESMTPILKELHWLPVPYRIQFKILLLVCKCLIG